MADRVTGHVHLRHGKRGPVWYARYRLADGRQAQKRLGPAWVNKKGNKKGRIPAGYYTQKTAKTELDAILTDARRGELPGSEPKSGHTFGEACTRWLHYVEVEQRRKPSTLRDYRNVVRGTLLPEFGQDTPLEQITAGRIDQYRKGLLSEGRLSPRTVQKLMVQMHSILERASTGPEDKDKWIKTNPARDVKRVTLTRSGDFNVLSVVEVEAVARAATGEQDAAVFVVAAFTGLRLGELRALRWRDVDFAKQTVHVHRSFTHGVLGTPKSGKVRSVPLIDQAARHLDQLSRREHFTSPNDLVFCTEVGGYLNDDGIRDRFYDALAAAGLGDKRTGPEPIVFHDLRHTFGTLAVQAWPISDVQGYMGHADIQTTMIYVHHQPKAAAANELTELVAAASTDTLSRTLSRTAPFGAQLSATDSIE